LREQEFDGKVAVVTGAASGICRAVITAFVEQGARGVIADVDDDYGEAAAAELRAAGGQARYVRTNVADAAQVARLFDQTDAAFGGVDIVVHGADIRVKNEIVDTPEDEWDAKLGVVLKGAYLMCREGARRMIRQGRGGRLINVGSTGGLVPRIGSATHTVSKMGVVMLTRVLAMELARHRITANVIAPGLTDVEGPSRKGPTSDEYTRNFLREVPMGRLGRYDEMVYATLFFARDAARYVTGQVLYVDGGYGAGKLSVTGETSIFRPPV
jgi:NAD(P)-dependent dehydrogenase (short-subunit alcohol dehydrogenase family)